MSEGRSQPVRIDAGKLRRVSVRGYALRFALGAIISLVAGILSLRFGPRFGGLFLAFPAILPASLTLIEDKEGTRQASIDALGASLGGVALVGFGLTAAWGLGHVNPVAAVLLAALTWTVAAVLLYAVVTRATRGFSLQARDGGALEIRRRGGGETA